MVKSTLLKLLSVIVSLVITLIIALKKPKSNFNEINKEIPWNSFDILKILVIIEIVPLIYNQLIAYDLISPEKILSYGEIILYGGMLWCVLYVVKYKYHLGVAKLGVKREKLKDGLNLGLRACMVVGIIVLLIAYFIRDWTKCPILILIKMAITVPHLFLLTVIVFVALAPIAEEILFRGFMYPAFKKKISKDDAMITSAIIWTIGHETVGFLSGIFLGIVLVKLYERTNSLIPCFIFHGWINGINLLLLFHWFFYTHGTIALPPQKAYLILGSLFLLFFLILQYLSSKTKAVKMSADTQKEKTNP
jgi:hypothetical protein